MFKNDQTLYLLAYWGNAALFSSQYLGSHVKRRNLPKIMSCIFMQVISHFLDINQLKKLACSNDIFKIF